MADIYEAPKSTLSEELPSEFNLYKVAGIGWATFLGSILAGGFLLSQNFKKLGRHDQAQKTLIYSIIATIIFFAIIFLIPEDINIPNSAFTIPQIVVMVHLAKAYQAQDIADHTAKGGKTHSNWRAVGIGLLIGIMMAAMVFAGVIIIY